MKALGVRVVATYVFWIHHEETQGVWRTDGSLDLRRFLLLCRKVGLEVFLRIGPWAHGECRNGGFPDWLQNNAGIAARTDDPAYLSLVRGLYRHIYEAAEGLLMKDGGPIIGIQLENEFGHCGGESGGNGLVHMRTLKRIAQEVGFLVPLYTATGWGGGNVVDGEMLPVMGGYADAPWEHSLAPLPASPNFLLLPVLNDPLIGSDWKHSGERFTYRADAYPYLTAELGGGIQCTFHRRPLITARDTLAQALCKLGTGANLLGYYMVHGGTQPTGDLSSMQESTDTGSWTDVPIKTYDFQAPLGEFGGLHNSAYELKNLHLLIEDAGEALASSMCFFPENQVKDAENLTDVRYSVRWNADTEEGFLFINNHQRLRTMRPHRSVVFTVQAGNSAFVLPAMDIPADYCSVLPINLRVKGGRLLTANASLLCRLDGVPVLVAQDGQKVEYELTGGAQPPIVLTQAEALHAWRVQNKLYICDGCVLAADDHLTFITENAHSVVRCIPDGRALDLRAEAVSVAAHAQEVRRTEEYVEYDVSLDSIAADKVDDILLSIDFIGGHAEVYQNGRLIADWYTTGQPWRMALKRFGYPRRLTVRVYAVARPTYFEIPVPEGMKLTGVSTAAQYALTIVKEDAAL